LIVRKRFWLFLGGMYDFEKVINLERHGLWLKTERQDIGPFCDDN
jgi:hypothetical protein